MAVLACISGYLALIPPLVELGLLIRTDNPSPTITAYVAENSPPFLSTTKIIESIPSVTDTLSAPFTPTPPTITPTSQPRPTPTSEPGNILMNKFEADLM